MKEIIYNFKVAIFCYKFIFYTGCLLCKFYFDNSKNFTNLLYNGVTQFLATPSKKWHNKQGVLGSSSLSSVIRDIHVPGSDSKESTVINWGYKILIYNEGYMF